jgi:trk system potassium uptake protein TrkH
MVEPASVAATLGTTLGATTLGQLPDIGPFGGFGDLAGGTKLVLTAQMLLGRLELLTLFALCSPSFWRR